MDQHLPHPTLHAEAELPPWIGAVPLDTETPPPGYRRYLACLIGAVRARTPAGFEFRLPSEGLRLIRPDAFIFMGGKLSEFSGFIPGIMEEFLYAHRTGRPIYLFGGLGGAAGVIAHALCPGRNADRPSELVVEHYRKQKPTRTQDDYEALMQELKPGDPQPEEYFDTLWHLIQKHRTGGLDKLLKNGLTHEDNRTLSTTDNTFEAVRLAWKGISQALLLPAAHLPDATTAPRPRR